MALPKGFIKNLKLTKPSVGFERRQEILDDISDRGTFLPRGVMEEDMDQTFLEFLKNNPFLPIFLFSAGNKKAKALSDNENVNVKELFFIEFYGSDDNVKGINYAIAKGALQNNIFTGGGPGTGKGIIKGSVDSKGIDHFDALRAVGFELKDKV